MKIYSRLLATTVATTMVSGALAVPAQAETLEKNVAGYTVSVDTTEETCTITPTDAAVAHAKKLGDAMWPGAEKAALSTGVSWAPDQLAKINTARKEGHKSGDIEVTTPMAALEAISPLAFGKSLADIWETIKNMPFLKGILGNAPGYLLGNGIYEFVTEALRKIINFDNLMQPGELAGHFLNPAVNASSPVVASEGETFTFAKAETKKKEFQHNIDSPPYANLLVSNASKTQAANLPVEFKQAWAAYNTDAVNVFKACSADTSDAPVAATELTDIDPSTLPTVESPNGTDGNGGNGGAGGSSDSNKKGSSSDLSSHVDNADKLSSLVGNEEGASKTVNTLIGVGVGVGAFIILGLLLAGLPALKHVLPPQIARLIP